MLCTGGRAGQKMLLALTFSTVCVSPPQQQSNSSSSFRKTSSVSDNNQERETGQQILSCVLSDLHTNDSNLVAHISLCFQAQGSVGKNNHIEKDVHPYMPLHTYPKGCLQRHFGVVQQHIQLLTEHTVVHPPPALPKHSMDGFRPNTSW